MKVCRRCRVELPLTEFSPRKSSSDGRRNDCRACVRAAHTAWRDANREALRDKQRSYWLANQERLRSYQRDWQRERHDRAPHETLHMTIAERLEYHSTQDGDCRIWVGAKSDAFGHGGIRVDGRNRPAHVVAYELATGVPVPAGHHVHHMCKRPACIEPAHLELLAAEEHYRHHAEERRKRVTS